MKQLHAEGLSGVGICSGSDTEAFDPLRGLTGEALGEPLSAGDMGDFLSLPSVEGEGTSDSSPPGLVGEDGLARFKARCNFL